MTKIRRIDLSRLWNTSTERVSCFTAADHQGDRDALVALLGGTFWSSMVIYGSSTVFGVSLTGVGPLHNFAQRLHGLIIHPCCQLTTSSQSRSVVPEYIVIFCWHWTTTIENWYHGYLPQDVYVMPCIDAMYRRCCVFPSLTSKTQAIFFPWFDLQYFPLS